MNTLIFFDINGTLIQRDARTDLPFEYALNQLLSLENSMQGVNTSARSDHDVFIEVLENHKIEYSEALWQAFLSTYIQQLEAFKYSDVWRENAHAGPFVKALSQKGIKLALITGELSIGAEYKLNKLGLWTHFKTGGFGEDGLTRFEIAEAAMIKAEKTFKSSFDEIWIIGDTLLDIKTARHIGAKVVSITTGSNTREELKALDPDLIIDDFSELADWI